ncbi:hypothetical protein QLL95_gp1112 [Cotonvirus japonicus]|uniref:Uncharacterized protein n=1 Tax=Cotonvirus japonicus TaxID=2811091 RepID=A0ABM7NS98_9VIRU|nr:hypothetical protein QLL95_gp1112 [Cotonvirus japonicus]BCS83011.1 hypothetical protein [Cotonvirus japonicus]
MSSSTLKITEIYNQVYNVPFTVNEITEAGHVIYERFGVDENDWYFFLEVENYIHDIRLINLGQEPRHSDTYRNYPKPRILKRSRTCDYPDFDDYPDSDDCSEHIETDSIFYSNIEDLDDEYLLPNPIALVQERQPIPNVWETSLVTVMENIGSFRKIMKTGFFSPLQGREEIVEKIFSEISSTTIVRNLNHDSKYRPDRNKQKEINFKISEYNSNYPVWSFIVLGSKNIKSNTIKVPFIREAGRAVNDINMNLKYSTYSQHEEGYVPLLIRQLVTGCLPRDISAIVFNGTVVIDGPTYSRGQRVRVLTKSNESSCLNKCKIYLEDFLKENSTDRYSYTQNVVRISLPK